jgi:hypothetical protein
MTSEPDWDEGLKTVIAGLARPHRSGGRVIERASLLASGADFTAAVAWIEAHGGEAEMPAVRAGSGGGLHGARQEARDGDRMPLRFVLPPGALV